MENPNPKIGEKMVDKTTIIVHSGDTDKLYSALIIGDGALAMGMESTMFFTFWGLERLKKDELDKGPISKMSKSMFDSQLKKANVDTLEKLITDYKELGGKIIACEMTMEIMGIKKEELNQELIDEYGAIGTYIHEARESKINLFI
jgi:peroxiredoxin family protein